MNNLSKIQNFFSDENLKLLIINSIKEEINLFYLYVFKYFASIYQIDLLTNTNNQPQYDDLFETKKISIYFNSSDKEVNSIINFKDKKILFTNYKIFKKLNLKLNSISSYEFKNDIKLFLKECNIENQFLQNFIQLYPFMIYSELEKFKINQNNYYTNSLFDFTNQNTIADIRKKIFQNNNNIKYVYDLIKNESLFKKLSFLTS